MENKRLKMSISFLIQLGIFLNLSCTNSVTCQPDWVVNLNFKDGKSRDLLKSTTPGYFHKKDIKTYTFSNGVKLLYTDSLMSANGKLLFAEGLDDFSLVVAMAEKTMLLQLSSSITDTVKVTQSGACPKLIDKVWYNSILVYDRFQNLPLNITIKK
jgi:hypothetical protein